MRPNQRAIASRRFVRATFLVGAAAAFVTGASLAAKETPPTAAGSVEGNAATRPLLTAPWPVSSRPFPKELPRVDLRQPVRASLLDGAPGRRKDDEPEALARGRRAVAFLPESSALTAPWFASPEELAEAVIRTLQAVSLGADSLQAARYDSLLALGTRRADYDRFVWPELPQSRAITNLESRDGWMFHDADCRDAVRGALAAYEGRTLKFVGLEYSEGIAQYTNFNLLRGVRIRCVDGNGEFVPVTFAPVFLERNGRWKVYQYLDN
jgi:hypothetical protein